MNTVCENCGKRITVQIFKGERWCSNRCRQALEAGEEERLLPGPRLVGWTDQLTARSRVLKRRQIHEED